MTYIDTHCHLNHPKLINKVPEILELCEQKNVKTLVIVGYDIFTNERALEIYEKYKENPYNIKLYISFGFHPKLINESKWNKKFSEFLYQIEEYKNEIRFIGEVGLDYFWVKNEKYRYDQRITLIKLFEIAKEYKKSIIIHCRNAWKDLIEILKMVEFDLPIILHAFSGSKGNLRNLKLIDKKIYFSYATNILRNESYINVVKITPLERILFETDSPYLSPNKEEINYPYNVVRVYDFVSQKLNIELEKLKERVKENFEGVINV